MSDEHMSSLAQRGKEVLEHYGKKGMRWGVTTKKPSSTSKENKAKKIAKDLSKEAIDEAKTRTKYNVIGITVGLGYVAARTALRDQLGDMELPSMSPMGPEKVTLDKETEDWIKDQNLPSRNDDDYGGMFNPDATLDRSRVRDVDDPFTYGQRPY